MIDANDARANNTDRGRLKKSVNLTQIGFGSPFPAIEGESWGIDLWERPNLPRDQQAMREIIIIASIGLLIVVVGIYVYVAEKARRRPDRESRSPWDKR